VKCTVDTDVNAAALAEHRWGAAQGIDDFVYITVGTGIGGGAMVGGKLVHGLLHPEMGHLRMPPSSRGVCPSHEHCLEGYASGTAIAKFGPEHTARYLALGIINIATVLSPRLVILGGGVMKTAGLLTAIRQELRKETYVPMPKLVRPKLGDRAGVLGAIALAGK
jgi:fructokinase